MNEQDIAFHNAKMSMSLLRHRPEECVDGTPAITPEPEAAIDDAALVHRIIESFHAAVATPMGSPDSFWLSSYADMKRPLTDLIATRDVEGVTAQLRNPVTSPLFYGFDRLNSIDTPKFEEEGPWLASWTFDNLVRVAEAVGALPVHYPEAPATQARHSDPEEILVRLDAALGFAIDFPNPFAGEIGLQTSRGVASYRAVQALYQAWRLRDLLGTTNASIAEIGGGLGRTAYYAIKLGFKAYTLVDLPTTGIAQSYFLGRSLGPGMISLFSEPPIGRVRIVPPSSFHAATDRYDMVVNIDSFTEMARETATDYVRKAAGVTKRLLSINHEFNPATLPRHPHDERDPDAGQPHAVLVAQRLCRGGRPLLLTRRSGGAGPIPSASACP